MSMCRRAANRTIRCTPTNTTNCWNGFWARRRPPGRACRAEREKELTRLHEQSDTPDDRHEWPPELGGGRFSP